MTENIAIIASHDGNTITPSTWERYAFAQKLKKHTGTGICFIFIGENIEKIQAELKCPEVSNASPLVMTLRQGALKPVVPVGTFAPKVICHRFDFNEEKMFYKGTLPFPRIGP